MVYSTVPNSVIYSRANTDQCGITGTITSSNQRPKLRMRLCQPVYSNFTIAWTPSTGPNAVSNPAIKNPTANPLTTQTYQVTVSQGGCSGSGFVTVNVDTSVKVNTGPDKSFCTGQPVQLTGTPSGSPLPGQNFSYQWKVIPAGTVVGITQTVTVNPSAPTTYVVTMTGGPCPIYDTISVFIGALGITHTATNISCNGANDGKIKLTASGTAPYSFQWSTNASTGNIDSAINLAPGTYYVTVTDGQNCVGRDTIIITEPSAVTFTSSVTTVLCNGGNNGLIAVAPSGGNGSYSFVWSNGAPSNDTAYNLTAGNYQVTVSDANSCSATGTFNVTQPAALAFNPAQTKDIRCFNGNDGFIIVSATGGASPYNYAWSHNLTLNQPNATNLTAGNYTVVVADTNNCTISQNFTLTQPANGLTVSAATVTDATCFGYSDGSATINAAGGATPYTYLWSASANNQTTQTATALAAGTYDYTVTDDSLCTAIGSAIINAPAQIQVSGVVTNVFCNGNSDANINVTTTNGVAPLSYAWNPTGQTSEDIINIPAGTYTITVTDNTSCSQSASFTVTEPPLLVLNAPTITNVSCYGGNNGIITANPAGGTGSYTYTWNPSGNTQTVNGLTSGTYNITLSDANSCSVTDSYQITEPVAPLAFGTPIVVDVLCNGAATGSITVSVTGGTTVYTYSWSHNNQLNNSVASSLLAGTYTVTVTDANSCTLTSTSTITQPSAITFSNPIVTDVSCFGYTDGVAEVTPTGGAGSYTYAWNGTPGLNPQSGLAAGAYMVVVTDGNSCTASTSVTISEPSALLVSPLVTDAACYGSPTGSIDANPSGGNTPYTFVWNDNQNQTTQVAVALFAGTYLVTVTDNTGCSASAPALVNEPSDLLFNLQTTQVSCPGDADGTITVTATGATPPYNYSATQDGANFVFATNGVIENLAPGYYAVIVSDNNGCTKVDTAFVPDAIYDNFTLTTDSTSCYGPAYADGEIHVTGLTVVNMPYQYSLDGGPNQFSGDFYFVSAGPHVVVATNNFGCTTTLNAVVPEPAPATAEVFPGDTTIELGETIQLSSTFGPYPTSTIESYLWTPSTGLSCIDCPNPLVNPYNRLTEYTLTITYNDHCVVSSSLTVIVDNNLEVFIPNSFSPNGDGNNDVFTIYGQGIKAVELDIFNRWGEKIYESNSQFAGWDGTYKGALQNPGVYVYNVKITFLDNRTKERTGSITILR